MASVQETLQQINSALNNSPSKHHKGYSCKTVSWDDVQRGTDGGALSCWGANITDTRLWAKDGHSLFTVRGDNWNERLGKVTADQIALVANDNQGRGTSLQPYTLRTFLKDPAQFGGYAGLSGGLDLSADALEKEVSVRFQTTFLPVGSDSLATLEFAPEAYNYNTRSDDDPRNLILLCTTQGMAVQQDGAGAKKLYHHAVQDSGTVTRHWLEAERSRHAVGGSQKETKEEKKDALARGKATASVIGVAGMGTRFNALMTIQIPLKQIPLKQIRLKQTATQYGPGGYGGYLVKEGYPMNGGYLAGGFDEEEEGCPMSMNAFYDDEEEEEGYSMAMSGFSNANPSIKEKKKCYDCCDEEDFLDDDVEEEEEEYDEEEYDEDDGDDAGNFIQKPACTKRTTLSTGTSHAARVSKGSFVDTWTGLTVKDPQRHSSEHITVTIVMYYVCSGGVPTPEDVRAAVDDLEDMYASLESGRLADSKFDFMKSELTVKDMDDIYKKLTTQPPPKMQAVANGDVFPTAQKGLTAL